MEKKLKLLFDYQRFENNARLARLIEQTENSYGRKLSEHELDQVNAAGDPQSLGYSQKKLGDLPQT